MTIEAGLPPCAPPPQGVFAAPILTNVLLSVIAIMFFLTLARDARRLGKSFRSILRSNLDGRRPRSGTALPSSDSSDGGGGGN